MTQRNTELLQQTMQYIIDHPEQHDQGEWAVENACGTTACFAGWAAMLSGWTVKQINHNYSGDLMIDIGENMLGLTYLESYRLFYACNTRDQLELMVKDLVNGDTLKEYYDY